MSVVVDVRKKIKDIYVEVTFGFCAGKLVTFHTELKCYNLVCCVIIVRI
jgi:hypothetical protein